MDLFRYQLEYTLNIRPYFEESLAMSPMVMSSLNLMTRLEDELDLLDSVRWNRSMLVRLLWNISFVDVLELNWTQFDWIRRFRCIFLSNKADKIGMKSFAYLSFESKTFERKCHLEPIDGAQSEWIDEQPIVNRPVNVWGFHIAMGISRGLRICGEGKISKYTKLLQNENVGRRE